MHNPCNPVSSFSQIVRHSIASRYCGDVELAAKDSGANLAVLHNALHDRAHHHRLPKISRLIDQVVCPAMRHKALVTMRTIEALRPHSGRPQSTTNRLFE